MTLAELVASGLAKLQAGMPPDVAAALGAMVEAETAKEGAEPLTAFRTALTAFRAEYERTAGEWAKGSTAVRAAAGSLPFSQWNYNVIAFGSEGEATAFCCKSCLRAQTEFACSACAAPGPGGYCYACGSCLAYSCPKCMAPWSPVQTGAESDALRMMVATVTEVRSSKDVGSFRLIVNSSKKDDWGTIISTRGVAKKIKPGVTRIDIDHQICKHGRASRAGCLEHDGFIDGAKITSVTEAIVPFRENSKAKPENVESVIIDVECSLRMPRAKLLYDGVVAAKYTDGSILFTMPKSVDEAVKAGRTDKINEDEVLTVPAITLTGKGSNPIAWVTEIRTARELSTPVLAEEPKPATTDEAKPEASDPLAGLRKAVGATGGDASAIPPATKPVDPSAPDANAAPGQAASVAPDVLNAALETLKTVQAEVTAIRAAAPNQEAKVGSLVAEVDTLRVSLQAADEIVKGLRTQNEAQASQIVELTNLVKETITLTTEGYTGLREEIGNLSARPGRKGASGAESSTEGIRSTTATAGQPTPEEQRHARQLRRQAHLARLAAGLL